MVGETGGSADKYLRWNNSKLGASTDGLVFNPYSGIMWIQTDDGAYTDVTNCMMLAALPGTVGDGAKKTLSYTKTDGEKIGTRVR